MPRVYHPNPKHESAGTLGRKGARLDLSAAQAQELLNDDLHCVEVVGKRQFVAVRDGKIYVFQDDGAGGYHAYPVSGKEVCTKYSSVAIRVAQLLGTDFKRLSRSE